MRNPTRKQFLAALNGIAVPGGNQLRFLQAHYSAPGRALTASQLAKAAGYRRFTAIYLHYGLLADRVGAELSIRNPHLSLLVEFARPRSITNSDWVMVMRPAFADALKEAGWVS